MNRVPVSRTMSDSNMQNRSTLMSSSGASTSSSTHTGAGLQRNTAKISDNAVSACSPPDSSDSVASFLPGG
jgi:cation transporter-like permease